MRTSRFIIHRSEKCNRLARLAKVGRGCGTDRRGFEAGSVRLLSKLANLLSKFGEVGVTDVNLDFLS